MLLSQKRLLNCKLSRARLTCQLELGTPSGYATLVRSILEVELQDTIPYRSHTTYKIDARCTRFSTHPDFWWQPMTDADRTTGTSSCIFLHQIIITDKAQCRSSLSTYVLTVPMKTLGRSNDCIVSLYNCYDYESRQVKSCRLRSMRREESL